MKLLAKQLGTKGIRVNGVSPGPVWTPLQVSDGATQHHLVTFGADYPLGSAGQLTELASMYVQLVRDDAGSPPATSMEQVAAKGSREGRSESICRLDKSSRYQRGENTAERSDFRET